MYGRRVICTDETNITEGNLLPTLAQALPVHRANSREIQRLWDIYRGKTDILNKTKEVRPEINHKICENRAYEIVNFYTGYVFGEPVQYIHRGACGKDSGVLLLNQAMDLAGKEARDNELAEWIYICGVGYRLALADREPIGLYTLDPRNTFCVRYSGADRHVVMAVNGVRRRDGSQVFTCYTPGQVFTVTSALADGDTLAGSRVETAVNWLGAIPIVEYTANSARLGVFEPVVPLLGALDELQSNRLDDVEATVNAFLVLLGAAMEEGQYSQLQEEKMLSLPGGTDAKYLSCPLDQEGVQTMKEDLYQSILTICGMPNRNGGTSTSDTGSAVLLRDGWQSAEARAKQTESRFKEAERAFLAVALHILDHAAGWRTGLKAGDILIKFTRRNYDNLQTKVQALTELLSSDKIHPETAFVSCGLFVDPIGECRRGLAWRAEQEERANAETDSLSQVRQAAPGAGGEGGHQVPPVQKAG